MRYETASLSAAIDLCAHLLEKNHAETGMKGIPLRVSRDVYRALDEQSPSFCILAKDEHGFVVGLAAVLIGVHPHTSELFAENSTIYVLPSFRSKGVGGRLFALAEKEARKRGATAFLWAAPVGTELEQALSKRVDISDTQKLFLRRL